MPRLGAVVIVTPNVGHAGARPSVRSSESIGKFDSSPPSTSVDARPVPGFVSVVGRNRNGIAIEARTASATGCSSGSRP